MSGLLHIQDLDPSTNSVVKIKLYQSVKNMPDLQQQIRSGDLNCCLIKPSLILDPFQIVIAANKAALADELVTKKLYTELLYNLSISKSITKSLQIFGIDVNKTDILVVVIDKHGTDTMKDVVKEIYGIETDISKLKELTNLVEVKKVYSLMDIELKTPVLLNSIISKIAVKSFL